MLEEESYWKFTTVSMNKWEKNGYVLFFVEAKSYSKEQPRAQFPRPTGQAGGCANLFHNRSCH